MPRFAPPSCRPLRRVRRLRQLGRLPAPCCRWMLSWGSWPSLAAGGSPARGGHQRQVGVRGWGVRWLLVLKVGNRCGGGVRCCSPACLPARLPSRLLALLLLLFSPPSLPANLSVFCIALQPGRCVTTPALTCLPSAGDGRTQLHRHPYSGCQRARGLCQRGWRGATDCAAGCRRHMPLHVRRARHDRWVGGRARRQVGWWLCGSPGHKFPGGTMLLSLAELAMNCSLPHTADCQGFNHL